MSNPPEFKIGCFVTTNYADGIIHMIIRCSPHVDMFDRRFPVYLLIGSDGYERYRRAEYLKEIQLDDFEKLIYNFPKV